MDGKRLSEIIRGCFNCTPPVQKAVWHDLAEVAAAIGKPTAYRAVAKANGANQLAIVIPCHRIINSNGELAGYGGGLSRKRWLLNHEKEGFGLL